MTSKRTDCHNWALSFDQVSQKFGHVVERFRFQLLGMQEQDVHKRSKYPCSHDILTNRSVSLLLGFHYAQSLNKAKTKFLR